jgi:CheY-like chemotaxis protein
MARILIVDDNCDAGEGLAKVFRQGGHEVKCVPNGKDALAEVLQQTPDAVLLDLMMPEMDGPSFLQVVRLYLRMHSLPVVVLTGFTQSPMIERALHLGVKSVLVKGKASSAEILKALEAAIASSAEKASGSGDA